MTFAGRWLHFATIWTVTWRRSSSVHKISLHHSSQAGRPVLAFLVSPVRRARYGCAYLFCLVFS